MNEYMRKTWRNRGFLPGGQLEKESDLCLYERPFPLISWEEPALDFCFESGVTPSLRETSEGLAFNWRNIESNSANTVNFIDWFLLESERKRYGKWLSWMGLPFKTSSFLALIEICFLFSLRTLVSSANFFVYWEEMFAYSRVAKQKSGWGWTVKNEAFEEAVKSLRDVAGERVSVEAFPSSSWTLSRGEN